MTLFCKRSKSVFIICVDDIHLFDPYSLKTLSSLFSRMDASPFLFLMTSIRTCPEFSQNALNLRIQSGSCLDFERAHVMPLWKPQQHHLYVNQIYNRTAGNPLLFTEYFH